MTSDRGPDLTAPAVTDPTDARTKAAFHAAAGPCGPRLYSARNASVGLSRAAFTAGYRPASAPIARPAAGAATSA